MYFADSHVVLSAALAAALGCSSSHEPVRATPAAPVQVKVEAVQRLPFPVGYRASGTVRGYATSTLTSKGTGHIKSVEVRSGDLVREGQLLLELEASDVRAGVARARAALSAAGAAKLEAESALQAAQVTARLAKTNHERTRQLFEQNVVARAQYDDTEAQLGSADAQQRMAQARVAAAEASIQQAAAALAETQALLGYTKLTAPFNGRVLERLVDPGTLASVGTPLLVVVDDGKMRVEASVPESAAADVKLGGNAGIELDESGAVVSGTIGEIVASVDPGSRGFLVKVDLPAGAPQLRSGAFARVTFPRESQQRLVVASAAISMLGSLERVFVVDAGRARLRMISSGERHGAWATVLSGLAEGERVVLLPSAELRDDSRVEVGP